MSVVLLTILGFLGLILDLVVLRALWAWFVVPFGVIPLGFLHAAGITLIGLYFKGGSRVKTSGEGAGHLEKLMFKAIIQSLVLWGAGALVHAFMVPL